MTDPFPAQSSILAAEALATRLLPQYDLALPLRCRFFHRGDNDTYLVDTVDTGPAGDPPDPRRPNAPARCVLRVYRRGKHPLEEVQAEVAILQALHRAGIPVAPAIARRDGRTVTTLPALEGRRHAVLFDFAAGTLAGFQMTPHQSAHYGQAVARMHDAFDRLPGTFARPQLDLEALLERPIRRLAAFLPHRLHELSELRTLVTHLRRKLERLPRSRPHYGLCHGDLHKRNVLFAAGDAPTILDFDCTAYGWRAYDLAVLLWSTALQGMGTTLWEHYLRAYQETRPLSAAELEAVPAFVAARDLWAMGVEIGRVLDGAVGAGQLPDPYWERRFATLREWASTSGIGPP